MLYNHRFVVQFNVLYKNIIYCCQLIGQSVFLFRDEILIVIYSVITDRRPDLAVVNSGRYWSLAVELSLNNQLTFPWICSSPAGQFPLSC